MNKKCESILDFIINNELKFGDKITNGINTWVISYAGSIMSGLADRKTTWLKGAGSSKGNIGYGATHILASIYMDNLNIYRPIYNAYKAIYVNKNNDLEISKHYFMNLKSAIQYLTNNMDVDRNTVQIINAKPISVHKKKDVIIYTLKDEL